MNCYNCGCSLSEKDFCTSCSADVGKYKQIMFLSNYYYNEGLEKAQIRDLSGAIDCLRQSLKMNKTNIQARNLLGLIYFEMGETVAALSEWVISKNYQPEKNIADDYISTIQSNQGGLDAINQTIKKFNLSLTYCEQGSLDVAKIQLRKVVTMNPKLIQARQLLALLYIKEEEWTKAKRELDACKMIDIGNVITNRYLKEVDEMLGFEESKNPGKKNKNTETAIWSKSGNDTIIQPNNPKEPVILNILMNVGIGLAVGLAIGWFLLGPIRVSISKAEVNNELENVREQLAVKSTNLDEMKQNNEVLQKQISDLENSLESYEGSTGLKEAYKYLIMAANEYNKGANMDRMLVADYLDMIDTDYATNSASEEFSVLYRTLKSSVGTSVAEAYYNAGFEAYRNQDYPVAIENLSKAVEYDPGNAEALYALANTYRENQDFALAADTYAKVIELFPDSEKAIKAQGYIDELNTMQ